MNRCAWSTVFLWKYRNGSLESVSHRTMRPSRKPEWPRVRQSICTSSPPNLWAWPRRNSWRTDSKCFITSVSNGSSGIWWPFIIASVSPDFSGISWPSDNKKKEFTPTSACSLVPFYHKWQRAGIHEKKKSLGSNISCKNTWLYVLCFMSKGELVYLDHQNNFVDLKIIVVFPFLYKITSGKISIIRNNMHVCFVMCTTMMNFIKCCRSSRSAAETRSFQFCWEWT